VAISPDTAEGEHQHAADDPARGAPADIRAVTKPRSRHLHRVMQTNQDTRQHGGQCQLHHHDAIDRRGG
jgi:hypothetical protein